MEMLRVVVERAGADLFVFDSPDRGQGEAAGAGELGLRGLELHHWELTAGGLMGWRPLPNSPEAVNHEHEQ